MLHCEERLYLISWRQGRVAIIYKAFRVFSPTTDTQFSKSTTGLLCFPAQDFTVPTCYYGCITNYTKTWWLKHNNHILYHVPLLIVSVVKSQPRPRMDGWCLIHNVQGISWKPQTLSLESPKDRLRTRYERSGCLLLAGGSLGLSARMSPLDPTIGAEFPLNMVAEF